MRGCGIISTESAIISQGNDDGEDTILEYFVLSSRNIMDESEHYCFFRK